MNPVGTELGLGVVMEVSANDIFVSSHGQGLLVSSLELVDFGAHFTALIKSGLD